MECISITKEEQLELELISQQVHTELLQLAKARRDAQKRARWSRILKFLGLR